MRKSWSLQDVTIHIHIYFVLDHDDDKESIDSEYVPSEDEQYLLEDNVLPQKCSPILSTSRISMSSLDATQINNGALICNDETMQVEASNKPRKQNYYIFVESCRNNLLRI